MSVHRCPSCGTYCLSSWQMEQAAGGWTELSYSVPQVAQMYSGKAGALERRRPAGRPRGAGQLEPGRREGWEYHLASMTLLRASGLRPELVRSRSNGGS